MARRSTGTKIAVALGVLGLCVVAAEVGMRVFAPVRFLSPVKAVGSQWPKTHRASDVPGLAYELVPGAGSEIDGCFIQVNADGLRGPELLPAETEGLFRIAILGDSIAFGWRVELEQCVSERLRARLAAERPGRVVEVMNFGVSGYSTRDEVVLLEQRVLGFDPDIVVVAYCMNDPVSTAQQPLPRFFHEPPVWQYSHLLRAIAKRRHQGHVQRFGGGDYYRYLHNPDGPEWPTVLSALDRLAEITTARSLPVVVAVFPWPQQEAWGEYEYAPLHDQVAAAAVERGFVALDLLSAFQEHAPREVVFSATDPHPTALGHDVASAELARVILPMMPE